MESNKHNRSLSYHVYASSSKSFSPTLRTVGVLFCLNPKQSNSFEDCLVRYFVVLFLLLLGQLRGESNLTIA